MITFCERPFDTLHLQTGSYCVCCPDWYTDGPADKAIVGELIEDPWEAWNHPELVRLREAILAGDFSRCQNCPVYQLNSNHMAKKDYYRPVMTVGPRVLYFANDVSCNLHCWSCRRGPAMNPQQDRIYEENKRILAAFAPTASYLVTLGSGDPFVSQAHLKTLREMEHLNPNLRIELFTNGILLPHYWPSLAKIHRNIFKISQSLDAASESVYKIVRRGGTWARAYAAQEYIGQLRQQQRIEKYQTNMVVSSDNFRDIPAFIETSLKHHADEIRLTPLVPWVHMTHGFFEGKNVCNPKHRNFGDLETLVSKHASLLADSRVCFKEIAEKIPLQKVNGGNGPIGTAARPRLGRSRAFPGWPHQPLMRRLFGLWAQYLGAFNTLFRLPFRLMTRRHSPMARGILASYPGGLPAGGAPKRLDNARIPAHPAPSHIDSSADRPLVALLLRQFGKSLGNYGRT